MSPQERIETTQLPLPFQPSPIARLSEEERAAALLALAQLLLSATGTNLEEAEDER